MKAYLITFNQSVKIDLSSTDRVSKWIVVEGDYNVSNGLVFFQNGTTIPVSNILSIVAV